MVEKELIRIFEAGYRAVQPAALLPAHLSLESGQLRIGNKLYNRSALRRLVLLSLGKAASAMALEAQRILGDAITDALVVTKYGHALPGLHWPQLETGHPVPDSAGEKAAARIGELLNDLKENDLVLVLISGGASALVADLAPGISLADWQWLSKALLHSGAAIGEINTVRKHFSTLKGGQLARLVQPASLHALLLSDVPGDDPAVIASGPTVPDPGYFKDAAAVLEKYHLLPDLPPAIKARLEAGLHGDIADTPKPGDPLFQNVLNELIGTNLVALAAAAAAAQALGYEAHVDPHPLEGDAEQQALEWLQRAKAMKWTGRGCLLAGGETTVTVKGSGKGGRNQHLALAALDHILKNPSFGYPALLCGGTDGTDGPTDAAGACITPELIKKLAAEKVDPRPWLAENDAFGFFSRYGGLLHTGPTQTNVMDLLLVIPPAGSTED